MAVWNPEDAVADLNRVTELDSSMERTVKKELLDIEEKRKEKDLEDKQMFQGKIF